MRSKRFAVQPVLNGMVCAAAANLIPDGIGFVVSDPTAAIKCTTPAKELALIGIGLSYDLKEMFGQRTTTRTKLGRGLLNVPNARSDNNEPNNPSDIWVDASLGGPAPTEEPASRMDYLDGFGISFSKCLCVLYSRRSASVA